MPALGASLKGVQAYLGRWGLAQPQPTRYTSCSSSRYTVQTGEKRTSDPAALLLPRPGASSADVREVSDKSLKAMDVKTEPDHRPKDLCKDERLIDDAAPASDDEIGRLHIVPIVIC
eukprot:COSAG03_NODE_30_length_18664_cov_5.381524_8_plen_117_part_00